MQFVTEKEVEEIKDKKQKEWEKVRRPDQPLERPEEEIDNRTLYEKLKVQKDQKQEEYAEQFKFKNMIYKGLDDEEAVFLQAVADSRAKLDAETRAAERQELLAYRDAVEKLKEAASPSSPTTATSGATPGPGTGSSSTAIGVSSAPPKSHKSQLSLIAGSIKTKRKRSSSTDDSEVKTSPEKKPKLSTAGSPKTDKGSNCATVPPTISSDAVSSSSALSGLTAYSSDSDDSSPD